MKNIDYSKLFTLRADGRYCASYTDETGKRRYIYSRDPQDLYEKLQKASEEKPYTFGDAAENWREEHFGRISFKTAEAYTAPLRRLSERFGGEAVESISAQDILVYLQQRARQGYSRRYVQMEHDIINMIFTKAIIDGHTKSNPVDAVSIPKGLPKTRRELPPESAVEAIKKENEHPFALFAKLCLYSGLRRGEALALRYEDIDRKNKVIHVTKAIEFAGNTPNIKEPKTEAGYRDAILLDVLAENIPKTGKGYIFCMADGLPLTKSAYRKRWKSYCKAIGYELTAHQLRHEFATLLYVSGVQSKDAQEILGHANIQTTLDIYTHIRKAQKDRSVDKVNAYLNSTVVNDVVKNQNFVEK